MTRAVGLISSATSGVEIGKRVRELRKWLRISQTGVGEYLDIPRSAVSALEGGKRDLGTQELLKLSRLFRCDPNSILGLAQTPVDKNSTSDLIYNLRVNANYKTLDEHDASELRNFTLFLKRQFPAGSQPKRLKPEELVTSAIPKVAAQQLRTALKISWPVDIYSVIQAVGLYPRFTALVNLAGAIVRTGSHEDAMFGILVNSDQPEERTRYSACHEVGHYFLRHLPQTQEVHPSLKARWKNPIESDADSFASEFLMPREAVEELLRSRTISSLETQRIADELLVSYQAMLYRLLDLNVISRVQHEQFSMQKPSELRAELYGSSKSRPHRFDVKSIKSWVAEKSESTSSEFINSPDWIRFVQEAACFEYWKQYAFNQRATEVKDVYEQVALWMAKSTPPQLAQQVPP